MQQACRLAIRKAEEAPYAQALASPQPLLENLRGKRLACYAAAARLDVQALLQDKRWHEESLCFRLPGLAAACSAATTSLKELVAALEATAANKQGQGPRPQPPVRTAYAGPSRHAALAEANGAEQQATCGDWTRAPPIQLVGISMGHSGGADIGGHHLLPARWADLAALVTALHAQVLVGTACRLLPGTSPANVLPDWDFTCYGARSDKFDATCIMVRTALAETAEWMECWSASSHTCWVDLELAVVGGFYIPPHGPNTSECKRLQLLEQIFTEFDIAVARRTRVAVYGDLNPTDTLLAAYDRHLSSRSLQDSIPEGVPTHDKGRRLDVMFATSGVLQDACCHNGRHCRPRGCRRPQCGRHFDIFGSSDLDHFPIAASITVPETDAAPTVLPPKARSTKHSAQPWFTTYARDPELWHEAWRTHADALCTLAAAEVQHWMLHRPTWVDATCADLTGAAGAMVWLWRAGGTLAALKGQAVQVSLPNAPARPHVVVEALTPAAVAGMRLRSFEWHSAEQCQRASKYALLCSTDPGRADAYLTRLLQDKEQGLPEYMLDPLAPTGGRSGRDVCTGAALYIERRGARRRQTEHYDRRSANQAQKTVACAVREAHGHRAAVWDSDVVPWSMDELQDGLANIKASRAAAGLPYAAAVGSSLGVLELLLAAMNAMKLFMVVPAVLKCAPVYHTRKRGRDPLQYSSHRTLSPNNTELRVLEELWASRDIDALWAAAGPTQMGRTNPLYILLIDVDTTLTRIAQGLPTGAMDLDLEEAFGTMPHPQPLFELLSAGSAVPKEDMALVYQMLDGSAAVVQRKDVQVEPVRHQVGIPEGRKLGPGLYVAGAAGLSKVDAAAGSGVGLDPPDAAVIEYHVHSDGSDGGRPNARLAAALAEHVRTGTMEWPEAMRQAEDDATRLRLIDLTSSTRVGMTQLLDDTTIRDSSWGGLAATVASTEAAIRRMGGALHAKKCGLRIWGFKTRRPIMESEPLDAHPLLGVPLDVDASMTSLMVQVETRGREAMRYIQARFDELGLPLGAYLQAMTQRVEPRTLWGAELLIVRADWEVRLDSLQTGWLRRLLDSQNAIPRWAVMEELGLHRRLRAVVMGRALRLLACVDLQATSSPDQLLPRVARIAACWPGTWMSSAVALGEDLKIPRIEQWLLAMQGQDMKSIAASGHRAHCRRLVRRYMSKIVWPAIDATERHAAARWWADHADLQSQARAPWKAVDAASMGWPVQTIRVWTQLRWRHKVTRRAASQELVDACPVCQLPAANTAAHLYTECMLLGVALSRLEPPMCLGTGMLRRLEQPTTAEDVNQALRVASCIRATMLQHEPVDRHEEQACT